jgi:hypothetical protein
VVDVAGGTNDTHGTSLKGNPRGSPINHFVLMIRS